MPEQYKPVKYLPIDYFTYPNRTAKNGDSVLKLFSTLMNLGATSPDKAVPVSFLIDSSEVPRNTIYKALSGSNRKGRPGFIKVAGEGPARWYFDTSIMPHPDSFTVDLLTRTEKGEVVVEVERIGSQVPIKQVLNKQVTNKQVLNRIVPASKDYTLWKGYGIGKEETMPKYWEEFANLYDLVDMFNPTQNKKRTIIRPTLVETLDLDRAGLLELYTEKNIMEQASAIYSDVERKDFDMAAYRFTYLISYVVYHYNKFKEEEN